MEEINTINELKKVLEEKIITDYAFQSLDFHEFEELLLSKKVMGNLFLGCELSDPLLHHLYHDNYIFPAMNVPYHIYPHQLYNKDSLYTGFDYRNPHSYKKTPDYIIYQHYVQSGRDEAHIRETLAARLHDHSITDALYKFLSKFHERKVIGIMGGHSMPRGSAVYMDIALMARELTEAGYLMVSGGGPGAMEATHVGAWFAGKPEAELETACKILEKAPRYDHHLWLSAAFEVLEKFPNPAYPSVGIPTWFYGHEPPTPFATHIAKYFANSVREEGLLAIAKGGIIFTRGSAGTMQEIFQELAQNHYETFGTASPMVFYDKEYWSFDRPVYPAIELMHLRKNLKNLNIGIYNTKQEVIEHIKRFTHQNILG
jgi:predicted Rossmann-fold nucleotide-binding protein